MPFVAHVVQLPRGFEAKRHSSEAATLVELASALIPSKRVEPKTPIGLPLGPGKKPGPDALAKVPHPDMQLRDRVRACRYEPDKSVTSKTQHDPVIRQHVREKVVALLLQRMRVGDAHAILEALTLHDHQFIEQIHAEITESQFVHKHSTRVTSNSRPWGKRYPIR